MTCTWLGYEDEDRLIGCQDTSMYWGCGGDHVGGGPVCEKHKCSRHRSETLEEHEKRMAPTPAHWMAL